MSRVTLDPEFPPTAEIGTLMPSHFTDPLHGTQAVPDNAGKAIPDLRDHRADYQYPAHVTLGAIELETLADHHDAMATGMRCRDSGAADLMEARATELRRWATRARAGA
jgi:hypothetical protein